MNLLRIFMLGLFCLAPAFAQTPEWIWHDNKGKDPAAGEITYFRKTISLPAKPDQARMVISGDDQATVWINGKEAVKSSAWNKPGRANVVRHLKQGENVIAGMVKNGGGDAAFAAQLELQFEDGKKQVIVTDTSWTASQQEQEGWRNANFQAANWTKPISRGEMGVKPWGDVFTPPHATRAETLKVPPGFKVELIRNSEDEGSWVAMAIDPKGRLIVSPQDNKASMLRVTLTDAGQVASVDPIDLPVGGAMGLLYAFDSLYVSGAGPDGLGLYRLKDSNGDDKYDKVELLKKIEGAAGEHGSHALVLGPDNMIYYMHGNFVKVPTDISPNSPHRNYAEDTLLPRGEDGNGFGVGIKPPGGFLLRGDPEGKHWEMVAGGMRNAYDFDFNQDGEMFTFDSDMEWDWGMPWYRPTRIYHLVSGGDYGFREGTAKYPAWYPDALPPTYDIGIGSPTGTKFGTGAKFPAKYQKAFYAMDWSYGRIFAVHLQENGASYTATTETFVQGKPLNVTDLEIGKDGAMYFLTGGRGTQSGLYRVSYVGDASTAPVQKESGQTAAAGARAIRKKLESFHGKKDSTAVDFAWPHLRSPDRWIRYAARIAIESQPVETWQQRALDETDPNASITSLLALARLGQPQILGDLMSSLGRLEGDDLSAEQKLAAIRLIQVAFTRMGPPEPELAEAVIEALDPLYPSPDDALNQELSRVLIYLEGPNVVEETLALLESAPTLEQQIFYVFNLRTLKKGWSPEQRAQYFSWFNQNHDSLSHPARLMKWFTEAGTDYRHGASYPKFLAYFKRDAESTLTEKEKTVLAPVLAGQSAPVQQPTEFREFVKEWTMDELAASLDQVSSNRSFVRGKAAFAAAQCLACHRFGNEGGSVGPDITTISSRFTRRDLLESIVDPSKVISEQYMNLNLALKDGEEVTGRIIADKDDHYVVLTNPLLNTHTEVKKSEIEKQVPSKFSAMPAGLINVLQKDEILDMMAYIESAGKANSAHFKK